MFSLFIDTIKDLAAQSGLAVLGWQNVVMILISFVFMYLAIRHKFEPLLLLPIAFGMLLANIPEANLAVQYHDLAGFRDLLAGRGEFVGCTPGLWTSFISVLKPVFTHRLSSLVSVL